MEHTQVTPSRTCRDGTADGSINRLKKLFVVERLTEIGNCAGGHALNAVLQIIASGNDDDWRQHVILRELPQNFPRVHVGHVKIEDDTVRSVRRQRVEEFPPRCTLRIGL